MSNEDSAVGSDPPTHDETAGDITYVPGVAKSMSACSIAASSLVGCNFPLKTESESSARRTRNQKRRRNSSVSKAIRLKRDQRKEESTSLGY